MLLKTVNRFTSQLLKSFWLFFPSIFFILISILCFWIQNPGKDIVIAFLNHDRSGNKLHFNYSRIYFFIAVAFWVYVSWYSSRVISYIKKKQEKELIEKIDKVDDKQAEKLFLKNPEYLELNSKFLDIFPRLIGNACFLVLEISIFTLPIFKYPLPTVWAFIVFAVFTILLSLLDRAVNLRINKLPVSKLKTINRYFTYVFVFFIICILAISYIENIHIYILLFLLCFFHAIFILYSNLRKKKVAIKAEIIHNKPIPRSKKIMEFFCIPLAEKTYYVTFLILTFLSAVLYIINIYNFSISQKVGPFTTLIFGFAVILALANLVTAFSVKCRMNFHVIVFVLALTIGHIKERHSVDTKIVSNNNYSSRPGLEKYLRTWLNDRNVLADTTKNGYDIYFIMSDGGASRSGYWTASVLGKIQDEILRSKIKGKDTSRFSDHIFCLSGTSGGGVGVATFFAMLRNKNLIDSAKYTASSQSFLKHDYFSFTIARLLGPDFFDYVFHFAFGTDRASALEESFDTYSMQYDKAVNQVPFYDTFSKFRAISDNDSINLPILFINTTRMQDGRPGIVSNLKLEDAFYNKRIDVVSILDSRKDISLSTGSILGARFPYLSPAGKIKSEFFVDGGYFDNSGAGAVQETMRAMINFKQEDSMKSKGAGKFFLQLNKLNYHIIHITNSPVIPSTSLKEVSSIKNDLMSPLITILGAYDMQTVVNNSRLESVVNEIQKFHGNKADFREISLYKDTSEWQHGDTLEPTYSMNWFMSDMTRNRINERLNYNKNLNMFIKELIQQRNK